MFALNVNLRVQFLYPGYLEQNRMEGGSMGYNGLWVVPLQGGTKTDILN